MRERLNVVSVADMNVANQAIVKLGSGKSRESNFRRFFPELATAVNERKKHITASDASRNLTPSTKQPDVIDVGQI